MAKEDTFKSTGARKRMYPGTSNLRPDNASLRRKEAAERLEAWNKLSPFEQLKLLDARLGVDAGAARQRSRIKAAIAKMAKEHETAAAAEVARQQAKKQKKDASK